MAEPCLPTDDVVHWDKHIATPVRTVLEHLHRRQMTTADLDPGQMGRNQRHGDAQFFFRANEMFGVVNLEREAEQCRHRPKRNVTLVPVEPQAQHLSALEIAFADHALVDHGRCVGACLRAGQTKTGNLAAVGQPWEPMLLLIRGAEPHQEFARPERIWHHHRHGGGERARRNLPHHLRMGVRRKAQPAEFRRNDHTEEFFALDESPDFRRQIAPFPIDFPVIEHGAELVDRTV